MDLKLKSMLIPEKVVTFDFPGCEDLTFNLTFLSKESNQAIYNKCKTTKFDRKSRQPIESFDDELFLQLYVKAILKGWDGFKLKYLKELVLIEVEEGQEEELLPYSEENALDLMKASTTVDNWISEVISDIGNFTSNNTNSNLEELKII